MAAASRRAKLFQSLSSPITRPDSPWHSSCFSPMRPTGTPRPTAPVNTLPGTTRQERAHRGHLEQSNPDQPVQPQNATDAGVPHGVVRLFPVLLRLVRHRAADGYRARGPHAHQGAGRQHHHRLGRHHRAGAAPDRTAVRQIRLAADLYLAADPRLTAGHGHRPGAEL